LPSLPISKERIEYRIECSDGYFAAQIKEDAARRMGIATMRDIFDNCMKMDPNPAKIQIIILQ
jgi:hypothetical protein